jgi:hypothetical protein
MTLSTFSRVTALLALVPSAVSWTLPLAPANVVPNYPVVPWKERGLYSGSAAKKVIERDGYSTGCNHGPAARSCWKGDYNVDTDMDLEWPTTGVLRKVKC